MLTFVFATCLAALLVAAYFAWDVLKTDKGTPEMQKIAAAIHTGAQAFLNRQNRTISILFLITGGGIFSLYGRFTILHGSTGQDTGFLRCLVCFGI